MTPAALANHVIDALGGTKAVSVICQVRQPSVSEWRVNGLPKAREQYLRLRNPEAFQIIKRKKAA